MSERIAKVIARSGVCSRRKAEEIILQKRVTVDGKLIDSPAFNVEENQKICIDGEQIKANEDTKLWLYHKPAGLITSHSDERGRQTVFDSLPKSMPRVISVGRLDINSEGLLLLTNSGELARSLELPSNGWARRYKVKVHGYVDTKRLKEIEKGIVFEGVQYAPSKIEVEVTNNTISWLIVSIQEGKNREVRNLMRFAGLDVARLIRLSYGPFQLGALKRGEVKEINRKILKEQLGENFSF